MGRARARVVWSGVDRLELSSTAPISPTEVQRLRAARAGRGATRIVTIADDRFEVKQRRGSHGAIRLVGENMTVALRPDAAWQRPTVSIEIGAFALACLGPDAAVMRAGAVLDVLSESRGGPRPSALHVSRIDLAADVQGWTVSPKDCTRLVSKGRLRDGYRGQGHFTGFTVGKGPLQARIYDKVREIAEHGGAWQSERWARSPHRRPGAPVWRVEVQLRREKLRSYARTKGGGRLDTWKDVRPVIPALWRHVTETWASFRLPRTGRTRRRFTPAWREVIDAFRPDDRQEPAPDLYRVAQRVSARTREAELDRLVLSEVARRLWLAERRLSPRIADQDPWAPEIAAVLEEARRRLMASPRTSRATIGRRLASLRASDPGRPPTKAVVRDGKETGCAA